MTQLFVKHIPPTQQVMLLVDGHSLHYEPETTQAAVEAGVAMFCLSPHSTHMTQPLDVSFCRPLKVYWSEACHKIMQDNPDCVVTKYQFSPTLCWNIVKHLSRKSRCWVFQSRWNPEAINIPSLPLGVDEGGVSDEDLDGDLHNERQGDDPSATDDPSMDRPGDWQIWRRCFHAEESHFTPNQIELFQCRYKNGYDFYTDTDYVAWLMDMYTIIILIEW